MKRKSPFVLLEILIGFALVSVSVLPFLRYPHRQMRGQLDALFEMELARFAQKRFAEVEVALCMNEIEEKYPFGPRKTTQSLPSTTIQLSLPNGWSRTYTETLSFESTAQKRIQQNIHYSLVHIYLTYHKDGRWITEYHSQLIAQKPYSGHVEKCEDL